MNQKLLLLKAILDKDEAEIARLYTAIARHEQRELDSDDKAILLGYHLHNLYAAFENGFKEIARTFENEVRDPSRWHAELLHRMTLDVPGLRPRFVHQEAFEPLDELRRFRHMFRSAYTARLSLDRLSMVLNKVHELEGLYPADFASFRDFLTRAVEGR